MAWTNIPDDVLEPGKPIRSVDAIALRDNPIALAQGLPGAPRVAAAALQTGNDERDWVLNRTAGASVGAVGTYAFLRPNNTNTYAAGSTLAGSSLRYQMGVGGGGVGSVDGGTPGGTWRCMGHRQAIDSAGNASDLASTLWLRIS